MSEATRLIHNIKELADRYALSSYEEGCEIVVRQGDGWVTKPASQEEAREANEKAVARSVYKYTSCGCCFSDSGTYVLVSGYCEGYDGHIEARTLDYPFTAERFEELVAAADGDGCDVWNETHGCPGCIGLHPEDMEGYDKLLAADPLGSYGFAVDPNCDACDGHGMII